MSSEGGSSWSTRRSKPVKSEGEVVDLGAKFGIAVGSDSDSSDAEFAPENAEKDSEDSESGGGDSSGEEGGDEEEEDEEKVMEEGKGEEGKGEGVGGGEGGVGSEKKMVEKMKSEVTEDEKHVISTVSEDKNTQQHEKDEEDKPTSPMGGIEPAATHHRPQSTGTHTDIGMDSDHTVADNNSTEKNCNRVVDDNNKDSGSHGDGSHGDGGHGDGSHGNGGDHADGSNHGNGDGGSNHGNGDGGGSHGDGGGGGGDEGVNKDEYEYNPLIVRRSNRSIKPTKDVDLYLLGAKFGIDVEESGCESSDMEFAPAELSPDSFSESSVDEDGDGKKHKRPKGVGREGEDIEEVMEVGLDAATLQRKALSEDDFSRSVSEMSINQEAIQQMKVDIHVALCAVCLEDSLDGDIVECDRCGISVHEGCYGVPEEQGTEDDKSSLSSFTTIPWFCDACKAGIDSTTCACELCPVKGGLYKQATNGRWVHMVCSLYTTGIEYVEPTLLSGVTLDCLSAARWGAKRCQLCEDEFYSRTGVCIGCDAGLCKSFFHATCAQQQGLLCEMDSDEENTEVADPYFAHCKAHSDKTIIKRKRRDFLTVANQQKRFKFNESDERIIHYLTEAKISYSKFFKKMINYYRPELTAHFEDRFFHFKPSALRRLTKKAQLLGFNVEVEHGVNRRKITPDLTNEFVNHFNERQTRQKELQELEKRLTTSHRDLREEELKMKHKVVSLEKELNTCRVEGQDLKQKGTALLTSLTRLSGETVTLSEEDEEGGEGEQGAEMKEDTAKSGLPWCTVCSKFEDSHLMTLCDTCNNHYHIHCLDPPLTRVPKKSTRWGWQCHRCCFESGDDLAPTIANFDEPASRCGRKINAPKVFTFPEDQVKQTKKTAAKSKKSKAT